MAVVEDRVATLRQGRADDTIKQRMGSYLRLCTCFKTAAALDVLHGEQWRRGDPRHFPCLSVVV